MQKYLDKATNVTMLVGKEQKTLITKGEIIKFIQAIHGKEYVNRSQAKRLTGLSYLGGVNTSAKIVKGLKKDYNTYIMYLQSYKTAFGNMCPNGKHCADACLNTSGRVKMDIHEFNILRSRYFKTVLFYVNREYFNRWLFDEITAHSQKNVNFMVRLNGTSDLSPKLFKVDGLNVLETFPNVQFYDYTKIPSRLAMHGENYHVTFSYDGYNMDQCETALNMGVNVSIVVQGDQPENFKGREVFTMDETDLRPLDKAKGAFGYLKLKETLNKNYDSKFVIKL